MHEALVELGDTHRDGVAALRKSMSAFPTTVSRSFACTGLLDAPKQFGGSCRLN